MLQKLILGKIRILSLCLCDVDFLPPSSVGPKSHSLKGKIQENNSVQKKKKKRGGGMCLEIGQMKNLKGLYVCYVCLYMCAIDV